MISDSNTTGSAARNSPWLGIVKFLFIAILIVIIFLLGLDMAHHRFHQGGRVNQNDTLVP
jgi:hypothetical protein